MRLGLWLTCLYVIAIFVRPQELFPALAAYNVMDIMAGLALLATVLDILAGARPTLLQAPVFLVAAFVLWTAFTVVAALRWFGGAALAFQSLSINIFVFALVVLQGSAMSRIRAMRRALIFALLLTVGLGLRAYYLGPRAEQFVLVERTSSSAVAGEAPAGADLFTRLFGRKETTSPPAEEEDLAPGEDGPTSASPHAVRRRLRALGFLNDPNDLAQVLVASLPLMLLAWRQGRPVSSVVLALTPAAAMVWAVLLTRSRGGLVALAALAYLAAIRRVRREWTRPLHALGLVGLFSILVAFFRLSADESALGRLEAWSTGLELLKESPVWGVGYSNFADHHEIVAHNSFVHCFAETGLVGYFLWLAVLLSTFWQLQRVSASDGAEPASPHERELDRWSVALRLSLSSFLVGALFLSRTYSASLLLILALSVALTGTARKTLPDNRQWSLPVLKLIAVTGVLMLSSIAATYAVVRLGR